MTFDPLNLIGHLANFFGLFAGVFAIWTWFITRFIKKENKRLKEEQERLDERISLTLKLQQEGVESTQKPLPFKVRRRDISRAEIQGLLGVIPMKPVKDQKGQPRYSIDYLSQSSYLDKIYDLQTQRSKELIIPCTKEEFEQFDFSKLESH